MNVLLRLIEDGRVLSRLPGRRLERETEQRFFPDLAAEVFEALDRPWLTDAIERDPVVAPVAEGAFLPIVSADRWEREVEEASARPPVDAPQWVTVAVPPGSRMGVALPEDAGDEPLVSVFTRIGGPARRLSFAVGRAAAPSASVSLAGACGFFVDHRCEPGGCPGECLPRLRESRPRGIVCVCRP